MSVWQDRFWEHEIRNDEDLRAHIDYCYLNPVKHGYVLSTGDWPYSSFHRDVALGLFDIHWNDLL
ncbi:transposase [Marinomonas primoryensis]|uniref:transposase n=1 Tax=Marinomonas primoryensis TaxID=178399 RepID=UPI003703ACB5